MAPLFTGLKLGFGRSAEVAGPVAFATGGNLADGLAPGNGYKYHTFGSPGTFTVSGTGTVEVLMVAGGGCGRGGGGAAGGGGGAGGLRYFSSIPVSSGPYSITVGGGSAAKDYDSPAHVGGTPTTAFSYTATGGGDAGSYVPVQNGQPGGSGGGGGSYPGSSFPGGTGTPGQGNDGGTGTGGSTPEYNGGGGGGAGGAGQPGSPGPLRSRGGDGLQYPQFIGPLIGVPSLNPLSGYFAGGGGGAIRVKTGNPASPSDYVPGGLGGGGPAGTREPGIATGGTSGTQYSGGGGGGDSAFTPQGSAGGPGIVIVRYLA